MKEFVPNYYHKFKCIAGECRHSCCIGWEIDIDPDTMSLYESLNSPVGEKIRANIAGDPPHFVLGEGERCPFLTESGLCEIITEHGDGALCDICYLHPRFINEYDTFSETGLGLCCEEAARLILSAEEKTSFQKPFFPNLKERRFLKCRNKILRILQDRRMTMGERLSRLGKAPEDEAILQEFLALERLDEGWTDILKSPKGGLTKDTPLEQFAVYLVYRHWHSSFEDADYRKVLALVLKCCRLMQIIADDENFNEMARMFSAEVEYSDTNIALLLRGATEDESRS